MTITMVEELVPDELWAIIVPLLPSPPRPWWGGRTRLIPDRNCFAGIVFMARPTFLGVGFPAQGPDAWEG